MGLAYHSFAVIRIWFHSSSPSRELCDAETLPSGEVSWNVKSPQLVVVGFWKSGLTLAYSVKIPILVNTLNTDQIPLEIPQIIPSLKGILSRFTIVV